MINWLKNNRWIILTIVSILVAGFAWLPDYKYRINPDAISYFTIAHKYARGDFRHAVNGYWGPLFSWLIAPSYWFHVDTVVWAKSLGVITAAALAGVTYVLAMIRRGSKWTAMVVAAASGMFGLDWALFGPVSPDLLFALLFLLLIYLYLGFKPGRLNARMGIMLGATGAALYFCKSAGFYLFVWMWLVWVAYTFFLNRPAGIVSAARQNISPLIVFALIITPFCLAISIKYHEPTVGTSGLYNFELVGPHSSGDPTNHYVLPPPNSTAVSAWEDPSKLPMVKWSPLSSWYNFSYFWKKAYYNLQYVWGWLLAALAVPTTLALAYIFLGEKNGKDNQIRLLLTSATVGMLIIYTFTLVETRYIWGLYILSLVGMTWFLQEQKISKLLLNILPLLIALPIVIGLYHDISRHRDIRKDVWSESMSMKQDIGNGDKLVSGSGDAQYICYYDGCSFYGVIHPLDTDTSISSIHKYGINRLLINTNQASALQQAGLKLVNTNEGFTGGRWLYETR